MTTDDPRWPPPSGELQEGDPRGAAGCHGDGQEGGARGQLEMRPSALHAHAHHGAPSQTARDAPLCLACRRSQRRAPLPHRHAREAHQWQRLLTCPSRRPMCPSRRPTCPPPQWWRLRSTGWPPRRRCSQQSASPKGTCMQAPSTRWPTPSFITMPRLSRHSNCWLGKSSAADSRPRWSG